MYLIATVSVSLYLIVSQVAAQFCSMTRCGIYRPLNLPLPCPLNLLRVVAVVSAAAAVVGVAVVRLLAGRHTVEITI